MSPLFITINYQAKLHDNGAMRIVGNGELFVYPQECWLLTPLGIITCCLLLLLSITICIFLSRVFCDFPLILWLAIAIGGALLVQSAGRTTFYEHKGDHVLIGGNKIEHEFEGIFVSIPYHDIKYVTHEDRGFIIIHKDYKKLRISDVAVSKLYGNELLNKRLEELLVKYPRER